jgi:hypothetical protein
MRINGLGKNQTVMCDRVSARLMESGGAPVDLYRFPREGQNQSYTMERDGGYQLIWVAEDLYNRLRDQLVGIEIDYSFTLLESNPEQTLPAKDGDRWLPNAGRCTTRGSATGTHIELACFVPGNSPCADWRLENKLTAQRIATGRTCDANAAPYLGRINGDSISRFGAEFKTPPLDAYDEQVVLQTYRPVAYFTRKLVTPKIRLSDWKPE